MSLDRRQFERSNIFLIAEFRPFKKTLEYSLGITKNFSQEGFSLESLHDDLKPGDILEFKLKHPHSDLSVSALGEIVWKKEAWYSRKMGIKFSEMAQEDKNKILELMYTDRNNPIEPLPYGKDPEDIIRHKEGEKSASELNTGQKEELMPETFQKDNEDISEYSGISSTKDSPVTGSELGGSVDIVVGETEATERVEATDTVYEQTSDLNVEEPHNNELRLDIGQATSNNTPLTVKSRRKKKWSYMPLVAVFAVISVVALTITFENIKKGLTTLIPATKSIFSQDTDKRQLVPFSDDAHPDGMTMQGLFEPLRARNTPEGSNKLPKEEKAVHLEKPVDSSVINQDADGEQPFIAADNAQSNSVAIREGNPLAAGLNVDVTFDWNSDVVNPGLYSEIDRIANALLNNPGAIVKVVGHTDSIGSELYNIDLSIRRATAVKNLLTHRGVATTRIEAVGFGESSPVASNDTGTGRMRNRRVEIKIVNP